MAVLDRLLGDPNGLLVSVEFAQSYNVEVGDTIAMRLPTLSGSYTDAAPRIVGLFQIFPTSAVNSDLVVTAPCWSARRRTRAPASTCYAATASPRPTPRSLRRSRSRLHDRLAVRIDTADRAISLDQSSLVGVNLAGLAALDRLYAALIVAVGLAVFLLGSVLERQREFGTLQALGATAGQVTRLLLIEAVVLVAGGVLGGLAIGALAGVAVQQLPAGHLFGSAADDHHPAWRPDPDARARTGRKRRGLPRSAPCACAASGQPRRCGTSEPR